MNEVFLLGGLTKDPELRYTPSGDAVCAFSIGTDAGKTADGKRKSDYHNIECWKELAERCSNVLHKGSKVLVRGNLKTDSWEKDGQRRYRTYVKAYNVQFLDPRPQGGTAAPPEEGDA